MIPRPTVVRLSVLAALTGGIVGAIYRGGDFHAVLTLAVGATCAWVMLVRDAPPED